MRVTYYGRELYHAEERAGHRYIARIPFGDKFRYFYDQAELAAYQAGKAMGGAAKAAGKAVEGAGKNLQEAANTARKSASKHMNAASKAANVAGKNIQGAANTARKSASKYMNTASKAVEGAGRNLQGATNTARKSASKHMNAASKAIKDTVTGIKAKAIQRDLEKKGVGKINTSLGDAYKTTSWTQQMYDKQLRENLVNNRSSRKPPAWMPGKNGPKNNQGIARIKDSGNAPKHNQGINGQSISDKVSKELKDASPEQLKFLEDMIRKQHRSR